jgi:tRNA dimethylallyltransferase
MDIGTAKPTAAEQAAARHWLIDVVDPDEPFTLASFLDAANAAIEDIAARGKTPIVAGGTGQYVWALLEGWSVPRVPPDHELRANLEAVLRDEGIDALAKMLAEVDPDAATSIDTRNPRRLIRAIEVTRVTGRPYSAWRKSSDPKYDANIVGLTMDRPLLYRRIDARVDAMLGGGFVAEVESLIADGYGCDLAAMSGIGYRQICEHLAGAYGIEAAAARMKTETHRLARMQHTWFRGDDPRIRWFDAADQAATRDALEYLQHASRA